MDAELHRRAKALFARANAVPAEARDRLLRESGEPEDVVAEVRVLLEVPATGFLETPLLRGGGAESEKSRWVGRELGGCRILDVLGAGGMGVVLLAQQRHPSRLVAIKVLGTGLVSEERERRFRYEAEVLGRLNHPGIATVHEVGLWDSGNGSLPYFVMEYVENSTSLTAYASQGGLSIRSRVELLETVCDAVAHGHQRGVVHRDLKPENILIDGRGRPRVIDFGIARCTASDFSATMLSTVPGAVLGTVQYMSPEHCGGVPGDVDTRSDVYSLGVILYELVCGAPPHDLRDRSLTESIRVVCDGAIESPRRRVRGIDRGLERVLLKALDRDPSRRYHTAADLGADLTRWLRGEPVTAAAATRWSRLAGWVARHPVLSTASVCAGIAAASLALTATVVWWINSEPFGIVRAVDGSEAYIVSMSGRRLATISGGSPAAPDLVTQRPEQLVRYVRRVPLSDDRWLAVLAFAPTSDSPWSGRLVAFDPKGDLQSPVWITPAGYPDFVAPHPSLQSSDDLYAPLNACKIVDICDDSEPEILVALGHRNFSPTCIQVLRARTGEVVFEAWHDGSVSDLLWVPKTQQIVVGGLANRLEGRDIGRFDQRVVFSEDTIYPVVIFGLTPQLPERTEGWIGSADSSSSARATWFKCVDFAEPVVAKVHGIAHSNNSLDRQTSVAVSISLGDSALSLNLVFDSHGVLLSRFTSTTGGEPLEHLVRGARVVDVVGYDPNTRDRVYWEKPLDASSTIRPNDTSSEGVPGIPSAASNG